MHDATRAVLFAPATLTARLARGTGRGTAGLWRWVTDAEHGPHYRAAIEKNPNDVEKHRNAWEVRKQRKAGVLLLAGVVIFLAAWAGEVYVGAWTWQAGIVAVVLVAVLAGGKRRAVTGEPAPVPLLAPRVERAGMDLEAIRKAFASALPKIGRADPEALWLVDPPVRDGAGWSALVELPAGVTASEMVGAADRLASAFGKAPLAVSVEPDPDHAGRVALWVGDKAPSGDVEWALSNASRVDVLDSFVVGQDLRGRPFEITLADKNVLIGAQPGYGKTATMRMILLAAALDPRTDIYAFDLKGGTDLLPLESCAVTVASGDEDEDVAELLGALRKVRNEISARNKHNRSLPVRERTDGKVTSADATRLGWAPIVFAIDEAQIAYENETYGEEIARLTIDIFKRGRSVGIHMLLATQQFDADSIPTKVTGNAHLRMCGRVESWQASNMVLGANAHSAGYSATTLTKQGVMWVKGATVVPQVVRMAKVTADEAWRIAARAAAARGRTVEDAADVEDTIEIPPVVDTPIEPVEVSAVIPAHDMAGRLRHVWPDSDRATSENLIEALQAEYPEDYRDWKPANLSRALGVAAKQVWIDGRNQRGYKLEHLPGVLERA